MNPLLIVNGAHEMGEAISAVACFESFHGLSQSRT